MPHSFWFARRAIGICAAIALLATAACGEPGPPPKMSNPSTDGVACTWCGGAEKVTFNPPMVKVYSSDQFTFVVVNRAGVALGLDDSSGRQVAEIRPGASTRVRTPGPGTYRFAVYLAGSPRPTTAPAWTILTVVAQARS